MSIPRIYLETTMFNFPFADERLPQYRQYKEDTLRLYEAIQAGKFAPYTSEYATGEIEDTEDEGSRKRMLGLISGYGVKILQTSGEAERLARLYIAEKVMSPAYPADALHIAITTVNRLDYIVSLNFQHIVRLWTIERVEKVNARKGYRKIGIFTPKEALEYAKVG